MRRTAHLYIVTTLAVAAILFGAALLVLSLQADEAPPCAAGPADVAAATGAAAARIGALVYEARP